MAVITDVTVLILEELKTEAMKPTTLFERLAGHDIDENEARGAILKLLNQGKITLNWERNLTLS